MRIISKNIFGEGAILQNELVYEYGKEFEIDEIHLP